MADNSDVTFKDLMQMQQRFSDKLDNVQNDLTTIKVQLAKNTVFISLVVSLTTSITVLILGNIILKKIGIC